MKKILIPAAAAVLICVLAAFLVLKNKKNGVEFKTEPVTRGDIMETIIATGTVDAVTTISVGTQVSGTIKEIFVDFNSPVKRGQLIARVDPTPLEAKVAQSRANLLSAKANLDKAKAGLLDAQRTRDRNQALFSRNLIARSDLDTAGTNYDAAQAGVSAAQAQVAQSQAALSFDETNLAYTRIVSPVSGTVIDKKVDVGQTVAASFQTPTLFTIAQDLTKMQIDTSVDEADIGQIKEGQAAEFTVDAYPETTFQGAVWQVRNSPTTVSNVVTYDAVIKMDNPDLKLKPGMTANVSIIADRKTAVLRIPNAALRFRPTPAGAPAAELKGPAVWILADGKPKPVKVTTGISDGNYTEVVSGELQENQPVIIQAVSNGQKKAQATASAPGFGVGRRPGGR